MRRIPIALAASALSLMACGSEDGKSETSDASTTAEVVDTTTVDSSVAPATDAPTTDAPTTVAQSFPDRPYDVIVPRSYDAATAAPLLILLHGYGATGAIQEFYFKLTPEAEARGFLFVHPDGTPNAIANLAWNATPACCHDNKSIDDSAYLTAIIDEVSATYNVDQTRVFIVGHSNGGFMSFRMACEHADRVAAIVSLAGATFLDTAQCAPSEPVNILQIHGTADGTIEYLGGSTPLGPFPSAATTVATWSTYNGCASATEPVGAIDLEYNIEGDETIMEAFTGCPADGAVELWTIEGGPHIPALQPSFADDIFDWLDAHPNT